MDNILYSIWLIAWIAGIVLSNGFCSCLVAITFPFWAWYLVIEKIIEIFVL